MILARVRRTWPPARITLTVIAALVATAMIAPIVVVLLQAHTAGWRDVHATLFRQRSYTLLLNTVTLTALVVISAVIVGTAAAWCLERADIPCQRVWTALLILPMAMPDFVVGFAWHSLWPRMSPLAGATAVMTLSTYPLVLLPVAAALRRTNPSLDDVARGLGLGPIAVFLRVTLPSIASAVAGGAMLAALTVISEYGAFEALRFHTLTTEIVTEFQFDRSVAAALSIPLILFGLIAVVANSAIAQPRTEFVTRPRLTAALQRGFRPVQVVATLCFTGIVCAAVLLPIAVLFYWMYRAQNTTLPAVASIGTATTTTFLYSGIAAVIVMALATPMAYLNVRHPSRTSLAIQKGVFVTSSVPGVIVAVALVYLMIHYLFAVYETDWPVMVSYVILFLPLGLVCVQATIASVPREFGDIARSLNRGPGYVFTRVTLPLIGPGLAAGFCLVFVTAITELTCTLMLAPPGAKTLATQFWAYQSESSYSAAAPYALIIIVIAVIPGALLGLWFDRQPQHTSPPMDETSSWPVQLAPLEALAVGAAR